MVLSIAWVWLRLLSKRFYKKNPFVIIASILPRTSTVYCKLREKDFWVSDYLLIINGRTFNRLLSVDKRVNFILLTFLYFVFILC